MKFATVSPVDVKMNWNPPRHHENITVAYFMGIILPSLLKSNYFSHFNGEMTAEKGTGDPPDLKWDFYGKLVAVKLRLIDSHQPWNYAPMDMNGKAWQGDATLAVGVKQEILGI